VIFRSEKVDTIEQLPSAFQLQEASNGVWCILQRMAPGPREVIHLTYNEGCSKRKVSQRLGIPLDRIDDLLQAGMRQLQDYINNCHWDDGFKKAC
jgi:DNA-directed RNA polymerase specialized sigma24 family protein